jgi:hypothetical protein
MAISSERRFKQTMNGLRAVHLGLWLGLFDAEHVAAANAAAYARWPRYRDESFNRSGLTDWERDAVNRHFPTGSAVLVPSAGAGREVIGLAALGHRATGFDPAPTLVEMGVRLISDDAGAGARLLLSPPDRLPKDLAGPFDAILFGWGGYIHVRGRERRVALLSDLRSVVQRGAPMLLSFYLRSPDDRTFAIARRIAVALRSLRGSHEPVELGDTVAGTFDHHFTWAEIESELADGGFAVLERRSAPYPHVVCQAR